MPQYNISAIDTVVSPHTPDILKVRPAWGAKFHKEKFGRDDSVFEGYTCEKMIEATFATMMDLCFQGLGISPEE